MVDKLIGLLITLTGRLVVWAISAGRWRSEKFLGDEARLYSGAGSFSFLHEGQRVITNNGLLYFGIAFYILLGFGISALIG